jgi:hypothetical protein
VVWGTQAGHLARTGGDDSGALGGLNVGAGKRKARKSWLSHAREGKRGGGPVWATPRGGRGRMGPGIPVAAQERRRRALVGRCSVSCGSKGWAAHVDCT